MLLLPASGDSFKSIQGTATCLPPARLELLGEVELLELGLVELDEPEVSELPVLLEVPEGLVELPVLPELLNERIAKSIRPEVGLIIQSLIVPSWLPDVPVT